MKGLLKNNFYATLSNAKVFAVIMLLLGIFVVAMDNKNPSLIIGYMTTMQIILGGAIIFACALLIFVISCPVTAYVYHKREY